MTFLSIFRGAAKSRCATGQILAESKGEPVVCPVREAGRHFAYHPAPDRARGTSSDPAQARNGDHEAQDQAQRHLSGRVLKPPISAARELRQTLDHQLAGFLRKRRGEITYAAFARKLGITPSSLFRLENCQQSITLKTLQQIMDRLKCS